MTSTTFFRSGKRLRIYIGEGQQWRGKPLARALLDVIQQHGAAGATVWKGVEGFGPEHHLSTDRLPDVADNLPVIVEVVESEAWVEQVLPYLDALVGRGMITVSPVEIVQGGRV